MATIVSNDDFVGEIVIAQLSQKAVSDELAVFIDEYEPVFLKLLLGQTLYDEFIAGLGIDEQVEDAENPPTPDQIWLDLKAQIGKSIAQYIYWQYIKNNNSQTSGIGQTKNGSDNAVPASPRFKMVKAWNKMVGTCFSVVAFINNDPDNYGDYYISNFYAYGYFNRYCNTPEIFIKQNTIL